MTWPSVSPPAGRSERLSFTMSGDGNSGRWQSSPSMRPGMYGALDEHGGSLLALQLRWALTKAAIEAVVAAGTATATSLGGLAGIGIGGLVGAGADRIALDLTSTDLAEAVGRAVAGAAAHGTAGALTPLKHWANARLQPRGNWPRPARLDLGEIVVGIAVATARSLIVTAFVPPGCDVVIVFISASSAFLSTAIANVIAARLDPSLGPPGKPDPWCDQRTLFRSLAGMMDAYYGSASFALGRMLRNYPACRFAVIGVLGATGAGMTAVMKRWKGWAEPLEVFVSGGHHGVHGAIGL
ncbi:hypothetical protein ACFQU1_13370 [Chelatococcus sp. GCM10030263]|uniref:hypothetical protein n=1 Tax=Chelatococcus sp. GCM10030263 TaxID=3273387 RepID=UPI003609001A